MSWASYSSSLVQGIKYKQWNEERRGEEGYLKRLLAAEKTQVNDEGGESGVEGVGGDGVGVEGDLSSDGDGLLHRVPNLFG